MSRGIFTQYSTVDKSGSGAKETKYPDWKDGQANLMTYLDALNLSQPILQCQYELRMSRWPRTIFFAKNISIPGITSNYLELYHAGYTFQIVANPKYETTELSFTILADKEGFHYYDWRNMVLQSGHPLVAGDTKGMIGEGEDILDVRIRNTPNDITHHHWIIHNFKPITIGEVELTQDGGSFVEFEVTGVFSHIDYDCGMNLAPEPPPPPPTEESTQDSGSQGGNGNNQNGGNGGNQDNSSQGGGGGSGGGGNESSESELEQEQDEWTDEDEQLWNELFGTDDYGNEYDYDYMNDLFEYGWKDGQSDIVTHQMESFDNGENGTIDTELTIDTSFDREYPISPDEQDNYNMLHEMISDQVNQFHEFCETASKIAEDPNYNPNKETVTLTNTQQEQTNKILIDNPDDQKVYQMLKDNPDNPNMRKDVESYFKEQFPGIGDDMLQFRIDSSMNLAKQAYDQEMNDSSPIESIVSKETVSCVPSSEEQKTTIAEGFQTSVSNIKTSVDSYLQSSSTTSQVTANSRTIINEVFTQEGVNNGKLKELCDRTGTQYNGLQTNLSTLLGNVARIQTKDSPNSGAARMAVRSAEMLGMGAMVKRPDLHPEIKSATSYSTTTTDASGKTTTVTHTTGVYTEP